MKGRTYMAGMRISGLATGMDIDSIVQDMIKAKRVPYDKMAQQKQTLEWKRDGYREMNTLLLSLREETLKMRLPSSFLAKTTTSSNEGKITAKADATAGNTTYTFNEVKELASAATNASTSSISNSPTNKIDPKASIYSLREKFVTDTATNPNLDTLNEVDTSFNWKTTDIDGVNETVKVTSAGKDFKLAKLSGGTIEGLYKDGNPIVYNSSQITVTKEDNTTKNFTFRESKDNLGENDVYVDKETGQLTFGTELEAESKFDISYKYIQKDTLSVSEAKKEFQLSNAGIKGNDGIKSITVTSYVKNADGTIKKDANGNATVDTAKTKTYSTFTANADGTYTSSDGKLTVDGKTGKLKFETEVDQGAKIEASYSYQYFEIDMKTYTSESPAGVTENIKINGGDSFSSVLDKISKSELGVSAFYDEYSDKVTLTRTETGNFNTNVDAASDGKFNEIEFENNLFFKNILKFSEGNETDGKNAEFTINGLETQRNSNTFAINGVTFTLKDKVAVGSPVTIGSTTDTEKVYENIKTFIDKYNETIDKVNKKTGEEYYRDYAPLTQEQRESLGEKEVELWEEKAKSGLLRRDQKLTSGLDKLRSDFYASVQFEGDSPYKQLAAIGITTTNLYNVNKGKLEIDEEKLKEAISNDPEAVYQLFATDGETYAEKGISRRLRDSLTATIQSIEETAGNDIKTNSQFTIGKNLDDLEDRMITFESRLQQYEDQYYKQFTAMEQAIQKMNQQSSYMMQQLGMATQ